MTVNWAGNVTFAERELARPTSIDELQEIVRSNDRVKALGSRHSFSTVADTTGVLVELSELPRRLDIDRERRTATVSSALRYAEIAQALDAAGLALANMGSLPHISVGGATATGTHGSGDGNQVLAASVAALDLVGADGELVHLDRTAPDFADRVAATCPEQIDVDFENAGGDVFWAAIRSMKASDRSKIIGASLSSVATW